MLPGGIESLSLISFDSASWLTPWRAPPPNITYYITYYTCALIKWKISNTKQASYYSERIYNCVGSYHTISRRYYIYLQRAHLELRKSSEETEALRLGVCIHVYRRLYLVLLHGKSDWLCGGQSPGSLIWGTQDRSQS